MAVLSGLLLSASWLARSWTQKAARRSGKAAPGNTDYITAPWPHNGNPHNASFTGWPGRHRTATHRLNPNRRRRRNIWAPSTRLSSPSAASSYQSIFPLSASINILPSRRGRGRGFHFRYLGLWAHISCLSSQIQTRTTKKTNKYRPDQTPE